jgi:predicted  nucleic acid-binding Zn-ribbon protein
MRDDAELDRLEGFVEKLLVRAEDLRRAKADLEARLREKEQLVAELRAELSTRDDERSAVNHRLTKVVDQLEQWERSLEEPIAEVAEEGEDLSAETEPSPSASAMAEETRVQHNLFSMVGRKD